MSHSAVATMAAVLVCLSLLVQHSEAHAVMISPKSRPWYDYLLRYNYNPHAVYAGGVAMVSDDGKLQWPARDRNGICGDAVGEKKWDVPGQIAQTYSSGQKITTDIVFAQNHLGRVQMRLCQLNAKKESECQDLKRSDGQGTAYDLPWTKGWWGVTDGFTPPVSTSNLPFRLYKMPPVGKAQGCAAWACDQFKGMYVYSFDWKLPDGFTCEHCKLQMYYLTASRCWPPCLKQPCKKPVDYQYCGEKGAQYPEEFWNCADIKVAKAGQVAQEWGKGRDAQALRKPNQPNNGRRLLAGSSSETTSS